MTVFKKQNQQLFLAADFFYHYCLSRFFEGEDSCKSGHDKSQESERGRLFSGYWEAFCSCLSVGRLLVRARVNSSQDREVYFAMLQVGCFDSDSRRAWLLNRNRFSFRCDVDEFVFAESFWADAAR